MSKPTSKAEGTHYDNRCDNRNTPYHCRKYVKNEKKRITRARRRHDKDLVEFFEWRLKNRYV